ncbi:MAG: phosphoribosylanthranilate isomerase [Proteobacteria bacterium]|nr:phosphoribosylanthranilate isomerase [Pseudomonadota bacterium]
MPANAKICGLTTPEAVRAALDGGATHVGFVFFPKSPRHVTPERAAELAAPARGRARVVAVTVDATEAELASIAAVLHPDLIQLHGHETLDRAGEVRALTGAGVIKAVSVAGPEDLVEAEAWDGVADHLMFDAKTPKGADLPGGMGLSFDWPMLAGRSFAAPWFLAGGLHPGNVEEAVAASGAVLVDVSSGVESAPGLKDPALIQAFLKAVERAG